MRTKQLIKRQQDWNPLYPPLYRRRYREYLPCLAHSDLFDHLLVCRSAVMIFVYLSPNPNSANPPSHPHEAHLISP